MPNKHVFYDILAKFNRANKHISDLEALWAACRESHPSGIRIERDPQSGDVTYFVGDITPIPVEASLIAGDALQNLRSALDHLALAMMRKSKANISTQSGFPIFDSAEDYADPKRGAARKIGGIHDLALQEIDRLKPYKGGNEKLWFLHRLNNIDKHRLLLTVGHYVAASTLSPSEKRKYNAAYRLGQPDSEPMKFEGLFMHFAPTVGTFVPLKVGDKLCTVSSADADQDMQFSIDIALNEPGVLRGTSLIMVLQLISSEVGHIVNNMGRFL
jgi:hypothetical protein